MRSTSLFRTAPMRSRPSRHVVLKSPACSRSRMSTTSCLHSRGEPARSAPFPTTPLAKTQQQSYSSMNWGDPSHRANPGPGNAADIDIKNPQSPSYDLAFGGTRGKGSEKEKEEETDESELLADVIGLDIADIMPGKKAKNEAPIAPRPNLRLVPRTGRTVYVKHNVDVARSFKLLAIQVAQNKVRRDFQMQRFHERPGKKRKRLRSERWQRRFKQGFKATVSRVRELTAQGW